MSFYTRRSAPAALLLVWLLVGAALPIARPAAAQTPAPVQAPAQTGPLVISDATLRVSPEYDDPGVLVIFYGAFGNISAYPQQVSFPLPANARSVQATEQDNSGSGSLFSREWQRQGDRAVYSLQESPAFQFEYYLDREPSGSDRNINYTFRAPYNIQNLTILVQQPSGATGFSLTPKEDSTLQTGDGLTSYQIKRTNVPAGEDIALTVRYNRASSAPSFNPPSSAGSAAGSGAGAGSNAGAGAGSSQAPAAATPPLAALVLIGVGIAALAGAAVYWFMEQRRPAAPVPARGRSAYARAAGSGPAAGRDPGQVSAANDDGPGFCRKCGREFAPADRFCGRCGTPRGE